MMMIMMMMTMMMMMKKEVQILGWLLEFRYLKGLNSKKQNIINALKIN